MIECKTYRQCGHSRSDPRIYRSREEEEEWQRRNPIPRFRTWLLAEEKCTEEQLSEIDRAVEQSIDEAVEFAESSPEPEPQDLLTNVFK